MTTVDAIVLAGGASRRMEGIDKVAMKVGDSTLLDHVLRAARPLCRRVVVVGPPRTTSVGGVCFLREDPPGGGPVPAVLAGLDAIEDGEWTLVLAADLPMVTAKALSRLLSVLEEDANCQAAAALDERGAPNPLLAAYRSGVLRSASSQDLAHGARADRLLPRSLTVVDLGGHVTLNVNRPSHLRRAEALLANPG